MGNSEFCITIQNSLFFIDKKTRFVIYLKWRDKEKFKKKRRKRGRKEVILWTFLTYFH